ncbi:TPA: hypothetical protein IAA87_02050, partial [Candidatus Avigastranaerophilus faecigallinarum]|nr:hypothetical protein [Candidatus Avigastranaerophilus faecigallinarum]
MKNKFLKIFFLIFSLFAFVLNASAIVSSEADINRKIVQLKKLSQYDYNSIVNKNELIGYRLNNFNMATAQYKNSANLVV